MSASRKGGASSVRAASTKGRNRAVALSASLEVLQAFSCMSSEDVDTSGYLTINIFTYKDGATVIQKPSGRKCRTCSLQDSSRCPVAKVVEKFVGEKKLG